MTLYEKLAKTITERIREGSLRAGDRVPSVRQMSQIQKVSVSTVLQAYLHLESHGWIEARPQSGFYVKSNRLELPPEPEAPAKPSLTADVAVSELISSIFESSRKSSVCSLGAACPDPELYPVKRLNRIVRDLVKDQPFHSSSYDFPPGFEELRRQIARRSIQWGAKLSASDIVTTSGGMEAIQLALRAVTEPGDTVLIESPTYYGMLQCIENLRLRAVEIPCHPRTGIDLDCMEKVIKKQKIRAALLIPNFNNPSGALMPEENKKAATEMLLSQGIAIIEDDIYGDLSFDAERPKTMKAYDPSGEILLCSSFSKVLAPGFRVGWIAPGKYIKKVERLKFVNTVATATLPQMAIAEYLASGGYDRYIRKLRQTFNLQVQRMSQAVYQYFPEGTRVSRPQGGFVLWVELPQKVDSIRLHGLALQQNISVCPGVIFSPSGRYRNFIRINCGTLWTPCTENALKTLGKLAAK